MQQDFLSKNDTGEKKVEITSNLQQSTKKINLAMQIIKSLGDV